MHEPKTRREEIDGQEHLQILRYWVAHFEQNLDQCRGAVTTGFQPMPSEDQFREYAVKARQDIADIDSQLGSTEKQ
jgi:hypothetical protein